MHSNPGASKRIYLDFDGNVTNGTYSNSDYANGQAIVSGAYDIDGNPADFSNAERSRIQWIWERVSEDFIPFNVDVTTEDPGSAALSNTGGSDTEWGIRVVVGTGSWWTSGGGGITYVGSFNWSSDTPAFVFSNQLGNGDEKYTAEAISHETGHSLGLDHDGRTSPAEEYYSGQGTGFTSGSTSISYAITGSGSNPSAPSDFAGGVLPSGTVGFAAGETSKTITVLISGDTTIENDEGFTVTLSNPSGSTIIATGSASGVIQNDDVALSVVASSATKAEGNSGSTSFTFYVSRTGDTSGLTTVDYTVFGSGANPTNASDFAGGTLDRITFAPGESSKIITVLVKGDTTVELDEQFTLSMWNASGSAVITTSSATGVIQNDDPVARGALSLAIRDFERRYNAIDRAFSDIEGLLDMLTL